MVVVYNSFTEVSLSLTLENSSSNYDIMPFNVSFRARKPRAQEKDALNISFLLNPLVTLILPTFTKDVVLIWEANLLTLALCYVYGFTKKPKAMEDSSNNEEEKTSNSQGSDWWIQAWKALDYGSGQERGARK